LHDRRRHRDLLPARIAAKNIASEDVEACTRGIAAIAADSSFGD
jgi:hypothetical protein